MLTRLLRLAPLALALALFASATSTSASPSSLLTTNAGAPVDNARSSLTAGTEGPILLQDYYLIERLQLQNRERIPERTVHARGSTAKGTFTVTGDVGNFTTAAFLNSIGKQTDVAVRFSTVIHGSGSPEFLRDPRGFALKFYTEEGNYDIVGLNFPVFFIRDGLRFPEMVHSLKPNPRTGQQEWWRIWDFFANYPESTHMFTWLLDDVGIPNSYRQMDGWGIHTFKWVSANGTNKLVRYYYKSAQGVVSLDDDAAVLQPFSFATADLYQSIESGNYPKWTVYAQLVDPNSNPFNFDPLDTTKQWPITAAVPLVEVGVLEFNKNVDSQFLENEMIAFSPSRLVPGIEPSDEKMLQARIFSYADAQRYRLGVNNQMLPINAPRCPFSDRHLDGVMNFQNAAATQAVNYYPSFSNPMSIHEAPSYHHDNENVQGLKVREMIKPDDFSQASARYTSWDDDRRLRFARRVASTLSGPNVSSDLLDQIINVWTQVNGDLAVQILKDVKHMKTEQLDEKIEEAIRKEHTEAHQFKKNFMRAAGAH